MATTNGNRKILDLKRWEMVTAAPTASVAGSFIASGCDLNQNQLYVVSNTVAYLYNPFEDGFIQLPSPALAGTFGAGAAGCSQAFSTGSTVGAASLTATAGTTTTITTNQTIVRDLRGYKVNILAGPNAGVTLTIVNNTLGANSVITVAAQASAFSASTVYRLICPRWYVVGAGTLASGSFKVYDYATNTWTTLSQTGLPATLGTDGVLISTHNYQNTDYSPKATGTATAGGASTLTNSAKTWTTNQWTNYQVRITSGTGAGQIRTIASNTATVLTTSAAWTTNPDATSVYSIETNDDYLYYLGNGATTIYRYSISANTWTTLAPGTLRAAAPTTGMSATWVDLVSASDWTNESDIKNGRYIYSFRGGAGAALDRYDIALNAWSNITYAPATETFTTGSKYVNTNDSIFIQKEATGRWFRYDLAENSMDGSTTLAFPQGAAIIGNTAFQIDYVDGATTIQYIYFLPNTSTQMFRMMII